MDAGRYATHLKRFLRLFPREHMRIDLYDDFRADPKDVLRNLFAFLAVDPDYPVDVSRRHNETVVPRFPTLDRLRRRLLGSRGARVYRVLGWLYYRQREDFAMDPEDQRTVIEHYRAEVERTGDHIGRDLSAWSR